METFILFSNNKYDKPRKPTGFELPVILSKELCDFLNVSYVLLRDWPYIVPQLLTLPHLDILPQIDLQQVQFHNLKELGVLAFAARMDY